MSEMRLGVPVRYKTVRGWSGKKYWIRLTEREIQARRIIGLIGCVVIGMPAMVLIMAVAVGLI